MEKYYIIPAEIIENNFLDDLDNLIRCSAIIVTDKSILEIAEEIVRD